MKKYILFFATIIISCGIHKNKQTQKIDETKKLIEYYEVSKIDSINNYYLIFAKQDSSLIEIVSRKVNNSCSQIKVNSKYQFKIIPAKIYLAKFDSPNKERANYLDIGKSSCYKFDEYTEICKGRYVEDLYVAENIRGLCLIKNK